MFRDVSSISSSDRRLSRRAALRLGGLSLLGLGLTACGFRPQYGAHANSTAQGSPVAAELAAIRVNNIPDRNGQLLRRGLEQRLEFFGRGTAARYELQVDLSLDGEQQGFRRDGTASRIRTVATAQWVLYTMTTPAQEVARGTEKTFDAYNIPDNQFFASDSSREAMERRLVETLAENVVQRLALRLQARQTG
ncbi:hypothetical protein IAI18_06230 [Acetobacteraceae bacterium H6797]|nr:hypothetical protein [Acetobacteraceae bacterium H6797]